MTSPAQPGPPHAVAVLRTALRQVRMRSAWGSANRPEEQERDPQSVPHEPGSKPGAGHLDPFPVADLTGEQHLLPGVDRPGRGPRLDRIRQEITCVLTPV